MDGGGFAARGATRLRAVRRRIGAPQVHWSVEEVVGFRGRVWVHGWVHAPSRRIRGVALRFPGGPAIPADAGRPSPDVASVHGPEAAACRFRFEAPAPPGEHADRLELVVQVGRRQVVMGDLYLSAIDRDPYHRLESHFWDHVAGLPSGAAVLEIGSRNRSGNVRTGRIPAGVEYVGMDVRDGPNVDVVGDAHELAAAVGRDRFDAVFAVSVFEHLLMPWKAALEVNHVLRPGGVVLVGTHQAFPLHDVPWDFWRFSGDAWRGLFNPSTGFRVREVAMGEPAAVVPLVSHAITRDTAAGEAYLASGVIAEKVGPTNLSWDVRVGDLLDADYPH